MRIRHIAIACAAVILAPLAIVHGMLRASLPQLEGELPRMGVVAPVTIDRDALGIPTIEAANRIDLAYGTGFVHGQDRFFQMDLSRRLAAGELSELFGEVALSQDREARLFRFLRLAQEVLRQATPRQRAVLEAYTRGVNAGLGSLSSRPWEYWVLQSAPVPWRAEDTLLLSYSMWWDLQYSAFQREILRREVNARLGGPVCAFGWKCGLQFLYPARTEWDAPNVPEGVAKTSGLASGVDAVAIPSAEVLDVRGLASAPPVSPETPKVQERVAELGSNNWAVAGRFTATGSALVANDMHLNARVPIVWYRARLKIRGAPGQPAMDLNGVTFPGAPVLVAGSNGHIAWGFTNSYGTWIHVEHVDCLSVGDMSMETPSGSVPLSVAMEEIKVHGQASVRLPVKSAPGGVLFEEHPQQHSCWLASWLAQQPAATNLNLMGLERATSTSEAIALAPSVGIAHQNFVVGDREGHIAWSIFGRIPVDTGPQRAASAGPWMSTETHPRIVDPQIGRLWTANARATDDAGQQSAIGGDTAALGADYDLGARAGQIRDDLLALRAPVSPADMLRIQLDDRAVFLARWRTFLLGLLDPSSLDGHPDRARFRQLVADWDGHAGVDSVGYRLVRSYHDRTQAAIWAMILRALQISPAAGAAVPSQFEQPLWRLVNEQPLHLLAARYDSWRQFLLGELDATVEKLHTRCPDLSRCTWGSRNPVSIRHPLSEALPLLADFLDMPTVELPGDEDMPRVQDGTIGASERFAVSPGHEEEGYLHMPGGESGHPLSPYYRAGFRAWAEGKPLPFLPGPSQHRLILQPP